MKTSYQFLFCVLLAVCYATLISCENVAKLPFCDDNTKQTELIFVSTLDGYVTALSHSGDVYWQIETGPGPLLVSNIHTLQLTKNGQWLRIIPSLSGSLYKFDGVTIDPMYISADTLLKSSFRYSDDLVIAGGREVQTYGVLLNSGKPLYECSLKGCKNTTEYEDNLNDIIIIERKTHTVHAVEPRTGTERWNFSVGQHSIKIPYVNCLDANFKSSNFNVTAILPEGLLTATKMDQYTEQLWQHKFESPIVAVWRWNGRELVALNLFNTVVSNTKSKTNYPSIYVGMHNKQLYVYESVKMQNILQLNQQSADSSVVENQSLTRIPWKPIPATNFSGNAVHDETDDSTALSVLYASEYVNGNGFYLYTEEKSVCQNNNTNTIPTNENGKSIWHNGWIQALSIAVFTIVIGNFVYNYHWLFTRPTKPQQNCILPTQYVVYDKSSSNSESSNSEFVSRYSTEFEHISCLGKGGFGVVFQAKKKFDECNYAVKRIMLPNKPSARNRMMREVKALAKLDHSNIVRYYNAWLESPPCGWQQQHDKQWLTDTSYQEHSKSTSALSNKNSSLTINIESITSDSSTESDLIKKKVKLEESSSIVFEKDSAVQYSTTSESIDKGVGDQSPVNNSRPEIITSEHSAPAYLYIQMQLCCKESLKDWLFNNPIRDHHYALNIFEQIVDAVEYVHFRGLIHRDLKPSNIFFSLEGQIKIGDFGLVTSIKEYDGNEAAVITSSLQESYTNAVGTHLYMSPEQLEGQQYDHKVDIYSLGIIFFELLVSFNTDMERICVLTDLRENKFPKDFTCTFNKEYDLLQSMLAIDPKLRPAANEIRGKLS